MKFRNHPTEQGQSLVTVALLLVVLIGMLALTLDGGYAYLQRRAAQTAADAGALAGARELCETGDANLAVDRALEYAIDRNGALEAIASVEAGTVTVEAYIPFSTFFGRIFSRPEITASAVAASQCEAFRRGVPGGEPLSVEESSGAFRAGYLHRLRRSLLLSRPESRSLLAAPAAHPGRLRLLLRHRAQDDHGVGANESSKSG